MNSECPPVLRSGVWAGTWEAVSAALQITLGAEPHVCPAMPGVSHGGVQKAFQKRENFLLPEGRQGRGVLEQTYCSKKNHQSLLESDPCYKSASNLPSVLREGAFLPEVLLGPYRTTTPRSSIHLSPGSWV